MHNLTSLMMATKNTKKKEELTSEYQHTKLRHAINGFIRENENNLPNNMIIPEGINDICFLFCCTFKEYQDLLCYRCGQNHGDKMVICTNEDPSDSKRDDTFVRNTYSALCPSHTKDIGSRCYKSMVIIIKE